MRSLFGLALCLSFPLLACDSTPTDLATDEEAPDGADGLAAADAASAGGSGMLVNLDMETDEGWWFWGPSGTEQGFSTEEALSGLRSIRLAHPVATGEGEFSFAGQYTPVEDPSEKKFTLTVRMKLENVTGQGVAIAIRGDTEGAPSGYGEAFATTQGKRSLVGTTDWMDVTVELDRLEANINSIAVYLILLSETSGTVYFDDLELSISDWTPIRTLMNGGFESGNPWPSYWWRGGKGYGAFAFQWHGVESWEGDRAVSISRGDASDEDFAFWAQTLFAQDFLGRDATLKVRIKTDLSGEGVSIVIRGDDTYQPTGYAEAFATTQGDVSITGAQDWTEYSVTLGSVPARTKSLTVYLVFLPETTGTVAFDAASLTR